MIQDDCTTLGEYGCNLFSFYYCLGLDTSEVLKDFHTLIENKFIMKDCTITNYDGLAKYKGKFVDVVWTKPSNYIKDVPYIGRFERINSNGEKIHHFVAMKNEKVIFNSLDVSHCVNEGKLVDIRKITWLQQQELINDAAKRRHIHHLEDE